MQRTKNVLHFPKPEKRQFNILIAPHLVICADLVHGLEMKPTQRNFGRSVSKEGTRRLSNECAISNPQVIKTKVLEKVTKNLVTRDNNAGINTCKRSAIVIYKMNTTIIQML